MAKLGFRGLGLRFVFFSAAMGVGLFTNQESAFGFIPTRASQSGAFIEWVDQPTFVFRANTRNSSQLSDDSVFKMFTTSLLRWKQVTQNGFSFTYYQGTDTARYPNYSGANANTIFFTSNGSAEEHLPCGIVALTEVWFDSNSGRAEKVGLKFNDNCYQFTTNPKDTATRAKIYLGDVATHEFGHALGLDHSNVLQSVMIPQASIQMAIPSCDDQAAMMQRLVPGGASKTGSIAGQVLDPTGGALFGAHVQAIQLERGTVISSTITEKNGFFVLRGLEPGRYTLVVEPFSSGAQSLGSYYSGIQTQVCNGKKFERTFLFDPNALYSKELKSVQVIAGQNSEIGKISISCTPPQGTDGKTSGVLATESLNKSIAVQNTFGTNMHQYYFLGRQSGWITTTALSYSLFSRADITIEFVDSFGRKLSNQYEIPDVFKSAPSGYVNYDAQAMVNLAQEQDIYIHVYQQNTLSTDRYPMNALGLDSTPYFILTVTPGYAPDGGLLPHHARCEHPDSFAEYTNQGEAPPIEGNTLSEEDDDLLSAFFGCTAIAADKRTPRNSDFVFGVVGQLGVFFGMWILLRRGMRKTRGG